MISLIIDFLRQSKKHKFIGLEFVFLINLILLSILILSNEVEHQIVGTFFFFLTILAMIKVYKEYKS